MDAERFPREIVDQGIFDRAVERFRRDRIPLPTFRELADPSLVPAALHAALDGVGPDEPHPLNLFRVHWYNGPDRRGRVPVPQHVVLPRELTGVDAKIVVALGDRFPMIGAHKVLAAYALPGAAGGDRGVRSDDAAGGVALDGELLPGRRGDLADHGCRGVAVLPEGMSARALRVARPVGGRSGRHRADAWAPRATSRRSTTSARGWTPTRATSILNQFSEYGNHLVHRQVTGRALERRVRAARRARPAAPPRRVRGGHRLGGHARRGRLPQGAARRARSSRSRPSSARRCSTNGFGEHNIQGIGDKHIPLIHNVMNTDVVVDVSDRHTDD